MTNVNRRELLAGTAIALAAKGGAATAPDFSSARNDFPWSQHETYLNNAGWHPVGSHSIRAIQKYLDFKLNGPFEGREEFGGHQQDRVKALFAQLIHAQPSEIAFVPSTLVGENLVAAGLGIPGGNWNVVTDELHYEGSLYMYRSLQKQGLDLRVVKPKDWRLSVADYEPFVDRHTRLIATSLVSYINGHLHNIRPIADLAHSHGAFLYTDIIQAAGAVPIDMPAMGIDFAACSGYKWLMGDRGIGFLFVREDRQGSVLRRTQYGDRQFTNFEYHMFPYDAPGPEPTTWEHTKGAGALYEVGNISNSGAASLSESLPYIMGLGVENIRAHARPLTARLVKEMPRLGYPCITPEHNESPTVAFVVKDPPATRAKLAKAKVNVKTEWHQMRVSPSVYNNEQDIDRLLNALS